MHKLIDIDNGVSSEDRMYYIKWYTRFLYYYFIHFILFSLFLLVVLLSDFIRDGLSKCIFRDYRYKVVVVYMICLIVLVYFKIWFNVWKIKIWSNMEKDPYRKTGNYLFYSFLLFLYDFIMLILGLIIFFKTIYERKYIFAVLK